MTDNTSIENISLDDDAREFTFTLNVPEVIDGLELAFIAKARWPFDVISVLRNTTAGDCDLKFKNNGNVIEFEDSAVDGSIEADAGALDESTPEDNTGENYSDFAKNAKGTVLIENPSTLCEGLLIQVNCRRKREVTV